MKDKIKRAIAKSLCPYLREEMKADYSYDKFSKAIKEDKDFQDKLNELMRVNLQRTFW